MSSTIFCSDFYRIARRGIQTQSSSLNHVPSRINVSDSSARLIYTQTTSDSQLKALSIDRFFISTKIRRPTLTNNVTIRDPRAIQNIESPSVNNSNKIVEKPLLINEDMNLPANSTSIGKQVAKQPGRTTLIIRRKKMRKHKLKKLRKRMKFEWAKKRQRRLLKREKEFQALLVGNIKTAEKFSAEAYVKDKLSKSKPLDIEKKTFVVM